MCAAQKVLGQCYVRVGSEGVAAAEAASAWGSDASAASGGSARRAVIPLVVIGGHVIVNSRVEWLPVVVGAVSGDSRQSVWAMLALRLCDC